MFKTILSSAVPIASSLISGIFGNRQQSKYISQQERANNIAFERNKQLAQFQNQLNIDAWNMQNQYNSPRAQMARLRDAGINPDLYYGGTSGLSASNSPTMSGGTPISPADYTLGGNRKTIGDTIANSLNMSLVKAQVDNLKADSAKKSSEKEGIDITNKTIFDSNIAQIKSTLSQAGFNEAQTNKVTYEIQSIQKSIEVASQQISLWQAQISNMSVQQAQNWLSLQIQKNVSDAQIKELCQSANLKEAQAKEILKLLPSKLANLIADTDLKSSQSKLAVANALLSSAQEAGVLQENDIREVDQIISLNMTKQMKNEYSTLSEIAGGFGFAGKLISGLVPLLSKIK